MRYCVHEVMSDDIDITPDKSVKIHYCNKCGTILLNNGVHVICDRFK